MPRGYKGFGWWLLAGIIGAGLVAVLVRDEPADDPMLLGVIAMSNTISGKQVIVGVSNRTSAEFSLVVIPEAMTDGAWKAVLSRQAQTGSGLPAVALSQRVPANSNERVTIWCPPEAIRLRANFTFIHRPARLESVLRKCLRAVGLKYPKSKNLSRSMYVEL